MNFLLYLCGSNIFEYDNYIDIYISIPNNIIKKIQFSKKTNTSACNLKKQLLVLYAIHNEEKIETKKTIRIEGQVIYNYDSMYCIRLIKNQDVSLLGIFDTLLLSEDEDYRNIYPSPLFEAIKLFSITSNEEIIQYFLKKNFSVNLVDNEGNNFLMSLLKYTYIEDHMKLVNQVVSKTRNLNLTNLQNQNCLVMALINNHLQIFRLLLSCDNIDANFVYEEDISLGVLCIILDKPFFFEELVKTPNFNMNILTSQNESLLMLCILYDRINFLPYIIQDIDVNVVDLSGVNSILFCIIYNKFLFLQYIICQRKRDIDLNVMHFIIENHVLFKNINPIIMFLIKNGADINHLNPEGNSPLMNAIIHDKINIASLLIQYNCEIDITNNENLTALSISCLKNNVSLTKLILFSKPKIDIRIANKHILNVMFLNKNYQIFNLLLPNYHKIDTRDCIICFYRSYRLHIDNSKYKKNLSSWIGYTKEIYFSNVIKYNYKKYTEKKLNLVLDKLNLSIIYSNSIQTYLEKTKSQTFFEEIKKYKEHMLKHNIVL